MLFATNPENKITHHVIYEVSDILIGGRKK